jgi:hypothetical protein
MIVLFLYFFLTFFHSFFLSFFRRGASHSVQTYLYKSSLRINIGSTVKKLEMILVLEGKKEKRKTEKRKTERKKERKTKVALTLTSMTFALTSFFSLGLHKRCIFSLRSH